MDAVDPVLTRRFLPDAVSRVGVVTPVPRPGVTVAVGVVSRSDGVLFLRKFTSLGRFRTSEQFRPGDPVRVKLFFTFSFFSPYFPSAILLPDVSIVS